MKYTFCQERTKDLPLKYNTGKNKTPRQRRGVFFVCSTEELSGDTGDSHTTRQFVGENIPSWRGFFFNALSEIFFRKLYNFLPGAPAKIELTYIDWQSRSLHHTAWLYRNMETAIDVVNKINCHPGKTARLVSNFGSQNLNRNFYLFKIRVAYIKTCFVQHKVIEGLSVTIQSSRLKDVSNSAIHR